MTDIERRKFWLEKVDEYYKGDLGIKAFCRKHNLSKATFYRYASQFPKPTQRRSPRRIPKPMKIMVTFSDGSTVQLEGLPEAKWLREFLE